MHFGSRFHQLIIFHILSQMKYLILTFDSRYLWLRICKIILIRIIVSTISMSCRKIKNRISTVVLELVVATYILSEIRTVACSSKTDIESSKTVDSSSEGRKKVSPSSGFQVEQEVKSEMPILTRSQATAAERETMKLPTRQSNAEAGTRADETDTAQARGPREPPRVNKWLVFQFTCCMIMGVVAGIASIPVLEPHVGFPLFCAIFLGLSRLQRDMEFRQGNPGTLSIGLFLAFFLGYALVHTPGREYVNLLRVNMRHFKTIDVTPAFYIFARWTSVFILFHLTEFVWVMLYHPRDVCLDSYLINQSTAYSVAYAVALLEFTISSYLFPSWKFNSVALSYISNIGLVICVLGMVTRVLAMHTAQSNFTHMVRTEREPSHALVQNGIYSLFRHPGYVGWFWYAAATQLIACNPISFLGYIYVSAEFFSERIVFEEIYLRDFFGAAYEEYSKKVGSGFDWVHVATLGKMGLQKSRLQMMKQN